MVWSKMTGWFVKNLGEALFAEESLADIKALFVSEYQKAGCPNAMVVFKRHETEGRLHCEVKLYFSPAAAVVAQSLAASPCRKPLADSLDFLAGSPSWQHLFSGQDR
jgi:hypothetical protein